MLPPVSDSASLTQMRATILGPLSYDSYDVPLASDIEAFRGETGRTIWDRRPSEVVIIGSREVVRPHSDSAHRQARQKHPPRREPAAPNPRPATQSSSRKTLRRSVRDLGKSFQSFDVKYAAVRDQESLDDFRVKVSGTGVNFGPMNDEDYRLIWALKSAWLTE
ncbi:hypothetical protein HPB50_001622 [Hyalomma asiaticum]|uniref:Uncharacterized protein n=1 Tax=Hyalomma asiaticum TaxID=266040 RepID=A0ACB7RXX4_HYAAI|nr:hypothetical protein HPB50_001622 [Hyalomma asiaticum]